MSPTRSQKSQASQAWLSSCAAAAGLTVAIFLLLAFAHRQTIDEPTASVGTAIRFETVAAPETSSAPAPSTPSPNLASLLPAAPTATLAPLSIETPTVEVSVDLSQMLTWRYGYADLGASGLQSGSFGVSNLSETDGAVQSIVIPPKIFPEALIDAGVVEGRVVVSLLIDEQGHVQVRNVISASHASLIPLVVESLKSAVYTIPLRDGKPTKVIVNRVVIFKADPQKVANRRAAKKL